MTASIGKKLALAFTLAAGGLAGMAGVAGWTVNNDLHTPGACMQDMRGVTDNIQPCARGLMAAANDIGQILNWDIELGKILNRIPPEHMDDVKQAQDLLNENCTSQAKFIKEYDGGDKESATSQSAATLSMCFTVTGQIAQGMLKADDTLTHKLAEYLTKRNGPLLDASLRVLYGQTYGDPDFPSPVELGPLPH